MHPKNVAYALEVAEGSQPPGFLIAFVTADENRAGATAVVNDMSAIAEQTNELTDKTFSCLEMTKSIPNQVSQVSNLVENTVALAQQSVEHASVSNEQLQDAMVSARKMKELARQTYWH